MKRVTFKVFEVLLILLIIVWFAFKFIFNQLLQLPSKESASLISRDGGTLGSDKKKPFSRPFSRTRFEPSGSSVRMTSPTSQESSALLRQNQELRQKLQEEASSYRRRLDTYVSNNCKSLVNNWSNLVISAPSSIKSISPGEPVTSKSHAIQTALFRA
jgi:hypothetical protein